MNKDTFIKDWMEGKVSLEELQELKTDPEYKETIAELEHIMESSSHLAPPKKKSKAQAWSEIADQLEETDPSTGQSRVIQLAPFVRMAVAATIIMLVAMYFLLPSDTTYSTSAGEQLSYKLPGGTAVMLNAETYVSFDESNWEEERLVALEGEAYFNVVKGAQFIVQTSKGRVQVIGTGFNVYNRGEILKVSCFEGKVRVINTQAKEIVLTKGQSSQIEGGNVGEPVVFNKEKTATWRSGEFYYENAPFSEVVAELERQYNVEITLEAMTNRSYTGYFNNKDLDEALKLVLLPMSYKYEQKGSRIFAK
ncbi:MAG: FecR domain-containing protein [Bacteroidota bacterium]